MLPTMWLVVFREVVYHGGGRMRKRGKAGRERPRDTTLTGAAGSAIEARPARPGFLALKRV
jgi:hypothetical protein